MPGPSAFEHLLRRDRTLTVAGLLALCVLTWLYVVAGAGMGMPAWHMTSLSLFPEASGPAMPMPDMPGMPMDGPAMAWSPAHGVLVVAMWWTMMIAMMTPSAAPTILLYARVYRHAQEQGRPRPAPTALFAAGYFVVWLLFSAAAAFLQLLLQGAGLLSPMMMASQVRWVTVALLLAAGLYQLTPLKDACLSQCRSPASFLSRHWRPGPLGALRLGILHGAFCVGCCWMLMALLFVGGVMNLVWIAALTLLVLAEKLLPAGRWIGRVAGMLCLAWGLLLWLRP